MHIPIICVTGTKGKTTTVAIIHDILRALGKNTLKVDTTGHFINGQRRSTLDDSKETWRLVPSVCPGRYLWEFHADPNLRNNGVAILESSLGSSSLSGMGYSYHDVGVFLNVFEDHLGSSERIKSRADIAEAKEFIFKRLTKNNGYAVFNADDKLVCEQLKKLPGDIKCDHILIPCGIDFSHFDLKQHLDTGGVVITMNEKNEIIMRSSQQNIIIANLKNIP
jgi:cyanophycin synthetase